MSQHKHSIIDVNFIDQKNDLVQEIFFKTGFLIIQNSELFDIRQPYFGLAKVLFEEFLDFESPKLFDFFYDCYGIYLPLGYENVIKNQEDSKAVIDIFPVKSYSYNYYLKAGFLSREKSEIQLNQYKDIFSENRKCLHFLEQVLQKLVPSDILTDLTNEIQNWLIRIIYYPPTLSRTSLRLAEHVDDDLLAMVISEDFSSLEIKDENGKFINIIVPPNCVLLLAGKGLEYLTQGQIKGVCHRVIGGEQYQKPRYVFNLNLGANLEQTFVKNYYNNIVHNKYFLKEQ